MLVVSGGGQISGELVMGSNPDPWSLMRVCESSFGGSVVLEDVVVEVVVVPEVVAVL